MKVSMTKKELLAAGLPLRMGVSKAMSLVNRNSKQTFFEWIEKNQIKTYKKSERGDREYYTEDLIKAVESEKQ
jgi:hypothetical protein